MENITQNTCIPKTPGREKILPGKLYANYKPATYRTKDGKAYYKFQYVKVGNHFEIDILQQPSYNGRNTGAHTTHRLSSSRGGKKICISSGSKPRTLKKAKKISMEWAELTHQYIQTGKTIDKQVEEAVSSNGSATSDTKSSPSFFEWLFG